MRHDSRSRALARASLAASVALGAPSCASSDDAAPGNEAETSACGVPVHPHLARPGASNLHDDPYMSDTYDLAGPSAAARVVRAKLGGECATVTFDAKGRIVTTCIAASGRKSVELLDPSTLEELARYDDLPSGLSSTSFGAGGYFYLDEHDRVVIGTIDGAIVRLRETEAPAFAVDARWDRSTLGLVDADGTLESALPDWSGRIWFVTENGAVGYVVEGDAAGGVVRLAGEAIGNSFAVDETGGVFVVSDHALYRFDLDASGGIVTTFREPYDRGTRRKPGQMNFGSGTTPTLLAGGLVAITDNAEPRMHVLVYAREAAHEGPRARCEAAVFAEGRSATENSLIGCGRSLVVENNYGYTGPIAFGPTDASEPGIARVDLREGASGCDVVWTSSVAAPSAVAKLSLASQLVYTYTSSPTGWAFTAVDFATGERRFDVPVGTDFLANNNYAPITIGAAATAYVGVIDGLVAIVPE